MMELQGSHASPLSIGFAGASPAIPHGSFLQKSQSNYLLGNDPARWRTHVPNYKQVVYAGLYPGIDAVFYGNGQMLEHDFVIAPGADYRQIRLHLSEHARATIANDGEMTIALSGGNLHMHKPVIYQDAPGGRQFRKGSFHLLADGDIGFTVESYDHQRPLVIDPVLSFSTYLSTDAISAGYVATDSNGNSYLTGIAVPGFPVTPGALAGCGSCVANEVVGYVSKLSADGKTLIYSTLVGGNGATQPYNVAVDSNGNVFVAGETQASDFPTKNGQPVGAGGGNNFGFLLSLSADGSSLNYGTLLGGAAALGQGADTVSTGLTVDATGNAYLGGDTQSSLFPTTQGALYGGTPGFSGSQVFLSKFSPTGTLLYSALLGNPDIQNGGAGPTGVSAVSVDAAGDVYVTGRAGALWPTTSGAYLPQMPVTLFNAVPYVAKLAPDGGSLIFSTYLDDAYSVAGIAVLPGGEVFVAGYGAGSTYPTTPNAYQPASTSAGNALPH